MRLVSRFTLARLLTFVAIVAVCLSLFINPALKRRNARRLIQQLGGKCGKGYSNSLYWQLVRRTFGPDSLPFEYVKLVATTASDQDLMFLTRLPELRDIEIKYSDNTDELFVPLINNMRELGHIQVDGTLAGDATAKAVIRHPHLKKPDYELSSLSMCQTNITPAVAAQIQSHFNKRAQSLSGRDYRHFYWSPIHSPEFRKALATIASHAYVAIEDDGEANGPELTLWLGELDTIAPNQLLALETIGFAVKKLNLVGHISNQFIQSVDSLSEIAELHILDASCNDLNWIASLPQVEEINVIRGSIGTLDTRLLTQLQHLRTLSILNTPIALEDFRMIAPNSSIQYLRLQVNGMDNAICSKLHLGNLKSLHLMDNSISDDGVHSFVQHHPELTFLRLSENKITDTGVGYITRLKKLESVTLDNNAITDAAAVELSKMKTLTDIWAANTQITIGGLRILSTLPRLTHIDLEGNGLNADEVEEVKSQHKGLEINY